MMNRTLTKLLDNGVDSDPSHEEQDLWKAGRSKLSIFLAAGMLWRDKGSIVLDARLAILVTI
jgi:hypothetical protein